MKNNREGFKAGLWLLRAFQAKIAQVCVSEAVYSLIRGAKGQEKMRHHFHATEFHVAFF